MQQLTRDEINERLKPIVTALGADGYELDVDAPEGGRLTARIVATADACPDCLVPKKVMSSLLAQAIGEGGPTADDIDLVYPTESH
jgi:hypothetical protein